MQNRALNVLFAAVLISLPLFALSLAISYFFTESLKTLSFVLFVIGAIPIFFYLPCLFTKSTSGSIHTPKVIYRLVGTLDKKKKNLQNGNTTGQLNIVSSLSIVLAGVILWAVSLYIQL